MLPRFHRISTVKAEPLIASEIGTSNVVTAIEFGIKVLNPYYYNIVKVKITKQRGHCLENLSPPRAYRRTSWSWWNNSQSLWLGIMKVSRSGFSLFSNALTSFSWTLNLQDFLGHLILAFCLCLIWIWIIILNYYWKSS